VYPGKEAKSKLGGEKQLLSMLFYLRIVGKRTRIPP